MPAINGSSALGHSYSLRSSSCIDGIGAKDNGFFIMPGDNEGVEAQVQRMKGSRGRTSTRRKRFVGVRQRPSGRWVAEIKDTTQKIRMWLGTFETAEAAARAYDEAACLLRGSNTRTNFVTSVSNNSPLASRIRRLLSLRRDSNKSNNAAPPFIGSPSPRTDEEAPASCLRFDAPPGDPLLSPAESCISTTTEELDHPHPPPPTHNNLKPHGLDQTESYCDRQPPAPSISEFPLRGHFDHSRNYSFLNSSSASIDDDLPTFDANYTDESSAYTKSGENGSCFNINIDQYFSWPFDFGSDISMQLPTNYDFPLLNDLITLPLASDNGGSSSVESELCSEQTLGFKRMKFERRISASLYAINGVQECLQNFSQPSAEAHGCNTTTTSVFSSSSSSYNETYFNSGFWNRTGNSSSPGSESDEQQSHADVLWDLPPLCPLSCKS